ncbi:MAG: N-methyl-D-aspartate receptor NMDAR2C subunit [Nanoarchaeota archaeon]|nr:N-methyl-D-aspartate receptor NMDAR2C subunit [Nanoarchaeota archaeon]
MVRANYFFDNLKNKFDILANKSDLDKNLFFKLLNFYSHPKREYHNLRHIYECLNEFESAKHLIEKKEETEIAIWFHDAIYDVNLGNNEEKSAELACEILKEQRFKTYNDVSDLILATKHNLILPELAENFDTRALMDIDLSILGKPEEDFFDYEKGIKMEYFPVLRNLTEKEFKIGRVGFLFKLLSRIYEHNLYQTSFFRDKYEAQAKSNLEKSLKLLCD